MGWRVARSSFITADLLLPWVLSSGSMSHPFVEPSAMNHLDTVRPVCSVVPSRRSQELRHLMTRPRPQTPSRLLMYTSVEGYSRVWTCHLAVYCCRQFIHGTAAEKISRSSGAIFSCSSSSVGVLQGLRSGRNMALELLTVLEGHTDRVWHVSWDPTGNYLATCAGDKSIRIWGPTDRQMDGQWTLLATLEDGQTRTIRSCEWSPCGRLRVRRSRQPWPLSDPVCTMCRLMHHTLQASSWRP